MTAAQALYKNADPVAELVARSQNHLAIIVEASISQRRVDFNRFLQFFKFAEKFLIL